MPAAKFRQDTLRTLRYSGSNNAQCIYWDEGLPGFGIRVFPNSRKSFVCSYRVQGRKRLATLGRTDVLTLEQARKKARGYLGQVADGEDPKAHDESQNASGSVKKLTEIYLERHAKVKKRSWRDDESYLVRYVVPKLGSRLASAITSADVAKVHAEIGENHPYAANRVVEILRKMYNLARKWLVVPIGMQNPAVGIERFHEEKRRRFVTSAEMPQLAKAINAESNLFVQNALWLLLLTGLRRNELLKSKWTDVDWKQRTLVIGKTKNGESLLAPLSRAAIARLKAVPRLQDNPHIICGSGRGRRLTNLNRPWNRVRTAADLTDLRIHDLRRTVGSWLVRDGASLHLVGAVLNHKDQKTTAGYAYFQTIDRQKVLDKHGRRVISSARPALKRADTGAAKSSSDGGSESANAPKITFTRKKLYELVWSAPVSKVAITLGISDVGLSKACQRANVPVPRRGYWAKINAGQEIHKLLLPVQPGSLDLVTIKRGYNSPRTSISNSL